MSSTTTTGGTSNVQNVQNPDKFVAWIDVLDPNTNRRASRNGKSIVDKLKKRGFTNLRSNNSLHDYRKERGEHAIEVQEAKRDLIPGLDADPELNALLKKANELLTKKDLAVPDENKLMLEQIRKIELEIAKKANNLRPGANVLFTEIVTLEKSVEFQAADQLLGGNFKARLKRIKEEANGTIPDIKLAETIEKLRRLKSDCTKIVREFETFDSNHGRSNEEISRKISEIDGESNRVVSDGKLPSGALSHFQMLLSQAREALDTASEMTPDRPAPPNGKGNWASLLVTAINSHHKNVATEIGKADNFFQQAKTFETSYTGASSAGEKKKIERLATIHQDINDFYDAAVAAGFTKDDGAKNSHIGLTPTSNDRMIDEARTFANQLKETLDGKEQEWTELKERNNSAIRYGKQLLAEIETSEQEFIQGMDSREKSVKTRCAIVKALVAEYENAIEHAKKREYQQAIDRFKKALGDSNNLGLLALRDEAQKAYVAAAVKDADLEERASAFNTSLGDFTTKSKIRFTDEAYEMMLGTGLSLDKHGDVTFSDQFNKIQKQFEIALKMWHELREKGIDPHKAADRAFDGIPENFWPPQAVRAIAMFRLAEAEFEEERQLNELEEQLRGGRVSRCAQKAIGVVDSVLDSKVGNMAGDFKEQLLDKGGAAVDVGSGIASSIGNVRDAKIAEYIRGYKDNHPGYTDADLENKEKEFEEKAYEALGMSKEAFEKAEAAFEILGTIGTAVSVLDGFYNMAKDGKDIAKAQLAINHYDPETDSPVELKLRQFERQRAIWHLVDHLADTILSGLGFVPDSVPAVGAVGNCLGDLKGLAIEAVQAYQYFKRLDYVRSQKNQAKYDRETMMELALANEAYKLGLLGSKKTFEAVTQLVNFVGDLTKGVGEFTVEVDFGATYATGFAINTANRALQYGGKSIFYVKNKLDDRSAKKALFAAKADPNNINTVEPVFEKCTMYARFALAHGAIHGDRWARNYILSRGVTDSDLDNPNTSTTILREYLNVTFQSKQFGEAEADKDYGAAKQAARVEASQLVDFDELTDAPGYAGLWSPSDLNLDSNSFKANYEAAMQDGLRPNKKAVKEIFKWLDIFKSNREAVGVLSTSTGKLPEFQQAYDLFETGLSQPAPDLASLKQMALMKLAEFVEAASLFDVTCNKLNRVLTNFQPSAKNVDNQLHEAMKVYLDELKLALEREYEPVRIFRDTLPKKKLALELELKPDDPSFVTDARAKLKNDFNEQTKELQEVGNIIELQIEAQWNFLQISTNIGKGTRDALVAKAASIIDASDATVTKELNTEIAPKFVATRKQIFQGALFGGHKIATDSSEAKHKTESIQDSEKRSKQIARVNAKRDKRIKEEVVAYWLDQAAMLLREEFNIAIDSVMKKRAQSWDKIDPDKVVSESGEPTPFALSRNYWLACKNVLGNLDWKKSKTGIGESLDVFNKAQKEWEHLKSDDILQANWRAAHDKLLNKLYTIPAKTNQGVAVPGVDELKKKFFKKLQSEKNQFEAAIAEEEDVVMGADGWVPSQAQLDKWPLDQNGWILMHDLARKHGWEGHNSLKSIGRLFKKYAEAKSICGGNNGTDKRKKDAKKACEELIKRLTKWDPNTKAKRRKPDHKGIMAYQAKVITRLEGIRDNELS